MSTELIERLRATKAHCEFPGTLDDAIAEIERLRVVLTNALLHKGPAESPQPGNNW